MPTPTAYINLHVARSWPRSSLVALLHRTTGHQPVLITTVPGCRDPFLGVGNVAQPAGRSAVPTASLRACVRGGCDEKIPPAPPPPAPPPTPRPLRPNTTSLLRHGGRPGCRCCPAEAVLDPPPPPPFFLEIGSPPPPKRRQFLCWARDGAVGAPAWLAVGGPLLAVAAASPPGLPRRPFFRRQARPPSNGSRSKPRGSRAPHRRRPGPAERGPLPWLSFPLPRRPLRPTRLSPPLTREARRAHRAPAPDGPREFGPAPGNRRQCARSGDSMPRRTRRTVPPARSQRKHRNRTAMPAHAGPCPLHRSLRQAPQCPLASVR